MVLYVLFPRVMVLYVLFHGVMVLYVLFPEHQRGDGEQALLLGVATSGPTWCLSEFRQCGRNNVFGNSLYKSQNSVGSSRSG